MQNSPAPRAELEKAKKAIQEMEQAASLDEFEEAWKAFLHRLERSFNKAQAHFKKSPKWDAWWGRFKNLRATDELLSYLINARGADEHSVEAIVARGGGGIGIGPAFGSELYIERMTINNGVIDIRSPQPIRVNFIPDRTKLLPVRNRGRDYKVPIVHLGKAIDPEDVVGIARLGHAFYSDFLDSAEAYFVKSFRASGRRQRADIPPPSPRGRPDSARSS